MIRSILLLSLLLAALLCTPLPAAVAAETHVPDPLKPWVPWVLEGHDRRGCPLLVPAPSGRDSAERLCDWPGRLYLDLIESGGLFVQHWRLYDRGRVPLPGERDLWPQGVRVGEVPVAVVEHAGRPAIELGPGDHLLSGSFHWRRMPSGLAIPLATGLISLRLEGEEIRFPRFERDGRLWLGSGAANPVDAEEDSTSLLVYRRVEDDNPLRVLTRLDMDVAGRARELTLGPVLLAGGIPLQLTSPLPARLEPDGRLRLQARPGHWVIEIAAHHPGPIAELALGRADPPWPEKEVWVFAAHPELRQVELAGAEPVDPRQTRLPRQWAQLPAYLLHPGEALRLLQLRRGDTDPTPDRLSLVRELWLDFGGTGFSLRDRISGELTRSWRLSVDQTLDLGQVLVDGEPRFITHLPDAGTGLTPGVEVRQGRVEVVADSRIEEGTRSLPASGWRLDFQAIETRLHLPPGWDLLAVSGVDDLPDTWLNRWSLLDLFLALVIALAVARLWDWRWGGMALVTMVLIWQEPGAPRMIWLVLLALIALLRLLPKAPEEAVMVRLHRSLTFFYRIGLILLAAIALPFLVGEVRGGLYPQLEFRQVLPTGGLALQSMPSDRLDELQPQEEGLEMDLERPGKLMEPLASAPAPRMLEVLDPDARVQTGPGVPTWSWRTLSLRLNGPVPQDHEIGLWLLSPDWNLAIAGVRLVLVLVLGLKIAGFLEAIAKRTAKGGTIQSAPTAAMLLLALGLGLSAMPLHSQAQGFPSAELLTELKARLLEPPECLPSCADIPHMQLIANGEHLELLLTADAATAVALPIPGSTGIWSPTAITLDGKPLDGLRRGGDKGTGGALLVPLAPGRWRIGLAGPLPPQAQIEIPLPLHPRRIEVLADGWRVEGIDEEGRPGPQIRLLRLHPKSRERELTPAEVPPLLRVRRELRLGVDWRILTRVERLSAPDAPLVMDVPLIPGEQVLREGAQVRDGRMLVGLAPGQREDVWSSSLEPVDGILLTASDDPRLSEEWRVDLSPLWHLEVQGIPPIHHQGRMERWLPTWRPWPGEQVLLTLSRPEGIPGPTLTLDASNYRVRPGIRVADAVLELTLRSSQGGQHVIRLPAGAQLQRATLNGVERPLRLDGQDLSLPLVPGTQHFRIEWRQPGAMRWYSAPPVPDLQLAGVNASVQMQLGQDRWLLFAGGPDMGPAVLFWSLVVVLVLVAGVLGRSRITPVRTLDWFLLGIGSSQAGIWVGLLVTGWLFALGWRARLDQDLPPWRFNLMQTGLFLLSLVALWALVMALQQGLLGPPRMQVAGNGSTSTNLQWYQDRSGPELPQVWVISVPILIYRGLMLAWALWLAYRLLDWLRWGWQGLSRPVLWREVGLALPRRRGVKPNAI